MLPAKAAADAGMCHSIRVIYSFFFSWQYFKVDRIPSPSQRRWRRRRRSSQ